MGLRNDSRKARLAAAIGAALLALAVREATAPLVGTQSRWLCFVLGVVLSAWYGGWKPGAVTTALLLPVGIYLNYGPGEATVTGSPTLATILFLLTATAICAAMQRLRTEQFKSAAAGARLHEVLESTQDAILSIDAEFHCLYANKRAGQIVRKEPALLFGKSLRTVFPETPSVIIYRELNRAVRERTPVHFEDRVELSRRWYEFEAYPAPRGLNVFIRDITEKKGAEEQRALVARALEEEHMLLESVLREMPVGVVITDAELRVQLVNPAAERLFGAQIRRGEDLASRRSGKLHTLEGIPLDAGNWPMRRTLHTGERVTSQELEYTRPDGETVTMIVNALPLTTPDNRIRGAIGTYLDVTSIRKMQKALTASETRLRRLFDSPIIGLISGDEERITEANDAYLSMLGYTREELAEIPWERITPPGYTEIDARAQKQLVERGFCDPVEKELIAKDGRRVQVLSGSASYDKDHWSPWISWVLDISDRRKLENRLREAGKLESIGLLAGGIAHDFNNILTSILGNTSLAFEAVPAGHEARELLQYAIRATERAADLTRQLLAYAGKGQFVVRPVDVSELTGEIAQLIRSSIPRNVELELRLDPALPHVDADATQLQQLVMNLVINGAEAAGEKPGRVVVRTEVREVTAEWLAGCNPELDLSPGEYVSLVVEDDGCGMDSETVKRIFDPFFTTKFTGRGLGLAAANGIVRAHKGAILVNSAPERGSVFQVLLPPSSGMPDEPVAAFRDHEGLQGEGTVMVVDDESIVRDVAKATLERYGYTVLTASNGQEALDIFRGLSHSIDLVILDMTVPRMGGEQAMESLLTMSSRVRILLSSGFDQDERLQRANRLGPRGFIRKPYTSAALAAKVRDVMLA